MPAQAAVSTPPKAAKANYPRKLFYRIQEVSDITGLKAYVLRYWETEFKELSPEKDKNDQRRYRQSDIDMILTIKDLLYTQKFTIAGARQRIRVERSVRRRTRGGEKLRHTALRSIRSELCELMNSLST